MRCWWRKGILDDVREVREGGRGSCKLRRVGGPSELGRCRVGGGFIGVIKITGSKGYSQGVFRQWEIVEGAEEWGGGRSWAEGAGSSLDSSGSSGQTLSHS